MSDLSGWDDSPDSILYAIKERDTEYRNAYGRYCSPLGLLKNNALFKDLVDI